MKEIKKNGELPFFESTQFQPVASHAALKKKNKKHSK